jgi:hypothetical protein
MVQCASEEDAIRALRELREDLMSRPLYAAIPSMRPEAKKTALFFHAKDDHPEIRAKVFELLLELDFKFYAVIKDMRVVRDYAAGRKRMETRYHYHPNELYDLTVRMLFKQRLHKEASYKVTFARRGASDRTAALRIQLEKTRERFLAQQGITHEVALAIEPAYSWERPGLQIADYCLWALQRCYDKGEARFLHALWPKVSLIHDVDDPANKGYGRYLTRHTAMPDPEKIKVRWV